MNSKVNGEHKEKVLQRWEGGDSNSDDYDLESDMVGAAPAEPTRPLLLGGGRHWPSAHSWSPRASGEGRKIFSYDCLFMVVRSQMERYRN